MFYRSLQLRAQSLAAFSKLQKGQKGIFLPELVTLRPCLGLGLRTVASQSTNSSTTLVKINTPKLSTMKVVMWKLYAHFHKHNTICTFVAVCEDPNFMNNNPNLTYNQQVIYYMKLPHYPKIHLSSGMLGFRKSHRGDNEAGYQVCSNMFKKIEEKRLLAPNDKIEVIVSEFGKGRDAFMSALNGKEGSYIRPHIVRLTDATPLKFGGNRSKKLRRI